MTTPSKLGKRYSSILNSTTTQSEFIPRLVALFRDGRLPLEKLTRFYALDEIDQAVRDAESGHVVKAILRP